MYDSHIYCEEYSELKNTIISILNNEIDNYDLDVLSNHIYELYQDGKMSSYQYDELMSYIDDLSI